MVRRRVVVGMVAVALLGGACTSGPSGSAGNGDAGGAGGGASGGGGAPGGTTAPTKPTWRRIEDPALTSKEPAAFFTSAATSADTGQYVVGGVRLANDQAKARPTIWLVSGKRITMVDDQVFGDSAGSVEAVATDKKEIVAAGSTIDGDTVLPEIWSRDNLGRWSLGAPEAGGMREGRLAAVAKVPDGDYVVAGQGTADGKLVGIVGHGAPGKSWTVAPVPEAADVRFTAVVANASAVVLLGNQRRDDGTRPTAWVSTDKGATWHEAAAGSFGEVGSGRVSTGAVIDGELEAFGTGRDGTTLMRWSSTDGSAWTPDPASVKGKPVTATPRHATVQGGAVILAAEPSGQSSFPIGVVYDKSKGWDVLSYPPDPSAKGAPLGAGPVAAGAGPILLIVPVPRSAEFFLAARTTETIRPGDDPLPQTAPFSSAADLSELGRGLLLAGTVGPKGDLSRIDFSPVLWTGGPGSLTQKEPSGFTSIRSAASDGRGGAVVVGGTEGTRDKGATGTDFNDIAVAKVAEDGSVSGRTVIGGPGEQTPGALAHLGDRWYLSGSDYPSSGDIHRNGRVWTSTDLTTWTPDPGDFPDGLPAAFCAAGATVIAVGYQRDAQRVTHPMVWSRGGDGSWSAVAGTPTGQGSFVSCTTSGSTTWIVGNVGQQPAVRTTTDGTTLAEVGIGAERYESASDVAASPDGVVIVGSDGRGAIDRPMLWSSRDGKTWKADVGPIAPSTNPSEASRALFHDGKLVVLGNVLLATALWEIDAPFAGS